MSRRSIIAASSTLALILSACSDPAITRTANNAATLSRVDDTERVELSAERSDEVHISYGAPQRIGNGIVRTYIITGKNDRGVPLEVGVAMSERMMDGLPAPMAMSAEEMKKAGHSNMTMLLLDLPKKNPTQYRFVQFDWNAAGHEPAGVYDLPHFDFHFYTVPVSVRNSIVPTDPQFAQKAASFPATEFRAPFYLDASTAAGAPPAAVTVPQMGLHWLDVRSPELQKLTGHPEAWKPFTKTFIYGSWDGQFIFDEPMITRAYIVAKHDATDAAVRDEVIPVSTAQRYAPAGYYPSAYRISWNEKAKEYRVALTQLGYRN